MRQETDKGPEQPRNRRSRADAKDPAVGKRRRLHPLTVWILVLLACLLCYPRAKALVWPDRVVNADGKTVSKLTRDINILLMGVDERDGDRGRSDTMMLLNYNALYNRLYLMSIPRDTRVRLAKYGYQKVNAAYPLGGPDLAKQTAGELTGLKVDYYLKVNFDGFSKVVDALGGVTIDIKTHMSYDDPYQDLHIHFDPGRQHLDGDQALEYVRWRGDARSDLARVERQREFLNAAFKRALSPIGLLRSPLVLYALGKCIDTDIPVLLRPGLASTVALAYLDGVKTSTVPGYTATIGDGSYFLAEKDELQKLVASWGKAPTKAPAAAPAK